MKLSPVQLIESYPVKLLVEQNLSYSSETEGGNAEKTFKFEHMTNIDRAPSDNGKHTYFSLIGVRNFNDTENAPYRYEVVVSGMFSIDVSQVSPDSNFDDMATKYSFTMLYGQVRELLVGLTSRMRNGTLTLPTMSFMDATFPDSALEADDSNP